MKYNVLPPDNEWKSIYTTRPEDGQKCMSKIKGEEGYTGECTYNDGYFESYEDSRNRVVITRWKHDLWLPKK